MQALLTPPQWSFSENFGELQEIIQETLVNFSSESGIG